jgi:S-formylglutathione hydrolase FrmB
MAFFDCHFFSEVLGLSVAAHVLVPQPTSRQIGMAGGARVGTPAGGFATLTLLHGLSDDHTIWMRRTSIERYAAAKNLAVVMPAVGRSFYQDMASGLRYWTFVSEELPVLMRSFFPLSSSREANFVAGLSMGGYGALRLALAHPENYAAAASLSGALDVVRICRESGREGSRMSKPEVDGIFGIERSVESGDADLQALSAKLPSGDAARPQLYLSCGTEDGLLNENRQFHRHLNGIKYDHAYVEAPGDHEWGFWDAQIQQVLDWLPLGAAEKA